MLLHSILTTVPFLHSIAEFGIRLFLLTVVSAKESTSFPWFQGSSIRSRLRPLLSLFGCTQKSFQGSQSFSSALLERKIYIFVSNIALFTIESISQALRGGHQRDAALAL